MINSFDGLDFTIKREEDFFFSTELEQFKSNDAETIYALLKSRISIIPFCDYLKRFIYIKAGFEGKWDEIGTEKYQEYIKTAFKETGTPPSFEATSSKLSALSKNWLTQSLVSRKTVFLLGFGLRMSDDEVSDFLKRMPQEGDFNFKNPFEVICCYCYKNGLGFSKMQELFAAYNNMVNSFSQALIEEKTIGVKSAFRAVETDTELLEILRQFKLSFDDTFSATATKCFKKLYDEIRKIIATQKQAEEDRSFSDKLSDYTIKLLKNSRLFDYEKAFKKENFEKSKKTYSFEDVSDSAVEEYLCSGTPIDRNGNLTKITASDLAQNFSKKRISKQRLSDVFSGKAAVDKFDIITLNFFIHAEKNADIPGNSRWWEFVEDTNRLLYECSLGELYIANPYDCFLQMCMLTDTPIVAYYDVIALSYNLKI